MEDDSLMEFGFDDSSHIKTNGFEKWKQSKAGQIDRACIVSFNRYHDVVLRNKAREKGSALTNEEQSDLLSRVDAKIAAQLTKKVEDLTEVDRLDIKSPKFWNSFTHFDDKVEKGGNGIGTFRCLSKWKGSQMLQQEVCCKRFNEADQKVACIVMTYPINKSDKSVNVKLLLEKEYTEFFVWVMNAKKFKKIEAAYAESRAEEKYVIDMKVELDGDPNYQKQLVTASSTSCWAKPDFDAGIRNWILEQGLRAAKQINTHLGFKLSKEKLLERMESGKTAQRLEASSSASPSNALSAGYDDLIS